MIYRNLALVCAAMFILVTFVGCSKSEKEIFDEEQKLVQGSQMSRDIAELRKKLAAAKDDFERSEIYGSISEIESGKGDISSSIQSANESIKYYPGTARSHYLLGKSYLAAGRYSESENELQTAVTIDEKFAPAHFELGNLFYKMHKNNDAISEYLLAIKYNQKDYQAYNNLGAVYQQSGKFKEAEIAFKKTKELNPKFAGVCKNLGILYEQKLKDKAAARSSYEEYLALNPNASDRAAVKIWIANLGN
jgi:tetratricopeptide (TPR) repeat protein